MSGGKTYINMRSCRPRVKLRRVLSGRASSLGERRSRLSTSILLQGTAHHFMLWLQAKLVLHMLTRIIQLKCSQIFFTTFQVRTVLYCLVTRCCYTHNIKWPHYCRYAEQPSIISSTWCSPKELPK